MVGAVLAFGLAWLAGAPDRAQAKKAFEAQQQLLEAQQKLLETQRATSAAQDKIAKLEAEREQREFFAQFVPKAAFSFKDPEGNTLTLSASEPFIVESVDYLTGSGAKVGSSEVGKSSRSIAIAIPNGMLGKIQQLGPWINTYDRSASVQFRLHLLKGGMRKQVTVDAVLKPEMLGHQTRSRPRQSSAA